VKSENKAAKTYDLKKHGKRYKKKPRPKDGSRWIPKGSGVSRSLGSTPTNNPPVQKSYSKRNNNRRKNTQGGNTRRNVNKRYSHYVKPVTNNESERKLMDDFLLAQSLYFSEHFQDQNGILKARDNQLKKKKVMNHLLGFTYGETRRQQSQREIKTRRRSVKERRAIPFDKEKFVQATYRFIVDKGCADVKKCHSDPDYAVNWDSVEQVIYPADPIPKCPICLEAPICPKITKCGHIFCWTCIMQYISLGGKQWRRCPLCFESVHWNSLKSLKIEDPKAPIVGKLFKFTLMEREKKSTLPKAVGDFRSYVDLALEDPRQSSPFHRVTFTENILPILKEEQKELASFKRKILNSNAEEKADLARAVPFIEEAQVRLQSRTSAWLRSHPSKQDLTESEYDKSKDSFYEDDEAVTANSAQEEPPKKFKLSAKAKEWTPKRRLSDRKNHYHFYQASDGQHVYMHGLNYRCLVQKKQGLSSAPRTLEVRVTAMDKFTLTRETRKKYKFLGHLPLTTEVTICSVALK